MGEPYLSPEQIDRVPKIEGRPELFETKVLHVSGADEEAPSILVATRDPGSGNALLPVIKELSAQQFGVTIITDGRAEEIMRKNFQTTDITPTAKTKIAESVKDTALLAGAVVGTPKVILMDCSDETGIESYMAATFSEVPAVLVEDNYGNTLVFLSKLKDRNLPLPAKICVMDASAKDMIIKKFPDLESCIEITGQPAFDSVTPENTEEISHEVRGKLDLQPTDKLVSYMSSMDNPERIMAMAEALKNIKGDFYFVFRKHPRDTDDNYKIYKTILTDAGIKVLDTKEFSTDEISAASDVVLTTWSTTGLQGIHRRKPTIHITDARYEIPDYVSLPLVPVKLGASVGINRMDELLSVLPQLLEPTSPLNSSLQQAMKAQYPADGKNTQRVVDIVLQLLHNTTAQPS